MGYNSRMCNDQFNHVLPPESRFLFCHVLLSGERLGCNHLPISGLSMPSAAEHNLPLSLPYYFWGRTLVDVQLAYSAQVVACYGQGYCQREKGRPVETGP